MKPKKFYDEKYDGEAQQCPKKGIISFLYEKLKKFEIYREDVANDLLSNGLRFLDIGCGNGNLVFKAREKFSEVWGVDISNIRLERARLNVHSDTKKIHFLQCDVNEGLPFNNSFFDTVTCIAVLDHVFNPPSLLKEVHRVIKLGGEFIVQVTNFAWLPYRFQLLLGKRPITGMEWSHLHIFTKTSLCTLLADHGFKIIKITASGIFNKIRAKYPSLLSADIFISAKKYK